MFSGTEKKEKSNLLPRVVGADTKFTDSSGLVHSGLKLENACAVCPKAKRKKGIEYLRVSIVAGSTLIETDAVETK